MQIELGRVNHLWQITGLTGGGPNNLDGVATSGGRVPVYAVVLVIQSGAGKMYQLQFSSLPAGPGVVVPVDNSTSNPVQWIELN